MSTWKRRDKHAFKSTYFGSAQYLQQHGELWFHVELLGIIVEIRREAALCAVKHFKQ